MKHVTDDGKGSAELFKTEKDCLQKALDIATGIKRLCDKPASIENAEMAMTGLKALLEEFGK